MDSEQLRQAYQDLSTPHVADACLRLGIEVRCAPVGTTAPWEGAGVVGRARPVQHFGSADIFLEVINGAEPGDVLVVDNGGRADEACVGDLVALEASQAGLAGVVIWGLHRDTSELRAIQLPVFSLGALPAGPQRLDPRTPDAMDWARIGDHVVTADDVVLGDDDGVLFVPLDRAAEVAETAAAIRETERGQALRMLQGRSLRQQTDFDGYLAARANDPDLTFRRYLRAVGAEIEE
ncbi:RraA family protein [Arthrobacter woluwensis]|uniref:RraA family protein n=1 Tax=Arthrobacter woluwensis TaxID=156980 RepID=UPI00380C6AAA